MVNAPSLNIPDTAIRETSARLTDLVFPYGSDGKVLGVGMRKNEGGDGRRGHHGQRLAQANPRKLLNLQSEEAREGTARENGRNTTFGISHLQR